MQTKLSIQEKLKDERTNRHMTLAQLEEATGISRSTLGKYESDDCIDISPFNLQKLADYYNVSMDYLLGRTENKNHPNTALYELHLSDSMIDLLFSTNVETISDSHNAYKLTLLDSSIKTSVSTPGEGFLRIDTDHKVTVPYEVTGAASGNMTMSVLVTNGAYTDAGSSIVYYPI